MQDFIDVEEAAELLGLSGGRTRKLCMDGLLDAVKKSGVWWISKQSVLERKNSNPKPGRPKKNIEEV